MRELYDRDVEPRIWLPSATLAPRREPDLHVLLWQAHGTADYLIGGTPHRLTEGKAVWVPAGIEHAFTASPGSVVIPCLFPVTETATMLDDSRTVSVDRDLQLLLLAHIETRFHEIKRNANVTRQIFARIECRSALMTALPMPHSNAPRIVAQALLFNPGDDRSVVALADSVHISVSSLERAFSAETGMTLRRWRLANRMETAAALLRSHAVLGAVAQRVGYSNTSAFHRAFKAHFSLTPGAYAARHRHN